MLARDFARFGRRGHFFEVFVIAVAGATSHLGWCQIPKRNNVVIGHTLTFDAKIVNCVAKPVIGGKPVFGVQNVSIQRPNTDCGTMIGHRK